MRRTSSPLFFFLLLRSFLLFLSALDDMVSVCARFYVRPTSKFIREC